jgi:hypothetical protein
MATSPIQSTTSAIGKQVEVKHCKIPRLMDNTPLSGQSYFAPHARQHAPPSPQISYSFIAGAPFGSGYTQECLKTLKDICTISLHLLQSKL